MDSARLPAKGCEGFFGNEEKDTPRDALIAVTAASESGFKPKDLGGNCLRLQAAPGRKLGVYQELDIKGEAGDNYVIGGWCRAWAAPSGDKRTFRLRVRFQKKSGFWENGGTADWIRRERRSRD